MVLWVYLVRADSRLQPLYPSPHSHWPHTSLAPVCHYAGQLKAAGLMSEVFTFVDATHLIAKATLWEEPDKARQQKIENLNNEVLPKVAVDKQARIGFKGKEKY